MISLLDWVIAFFMAITFFSFILTIPSFISMYFDGFKNHIFRIKSIIFLSNNIDKCYQYKNIVNIKGYYEESYYYYYPVYKNDNNIYLLEERVFLHLHHYSFKDGIWDVQNINIETTACFWTMMCKEILRFKIKRKKKDSIFIENINNLDDIIDSDIVSLKRDNRLKKLGI